MDTPRIVIRPRNQPAPDDAPPTPIRRSEMSDHSHDSHGHHAEDPMVCIKVGVFFLAALLTLVLLKL